ncbi:IS3 family transposase [Streptomyces sp. ISL-87]|nr:MULTISPECIES: IS3 family transposase [unclassified Streptomyces]MBT2404428.1 IS3 family transposase [Streptomyces sp. ISL-21]MBT2612518.1 IS3 family transposase [Streptomyces sp. ISL-87]
MSAICRFIHAEKAHYAITLLCRVLKKARSTYYAWVAGIEVREARCLADEVLAHEITVIHVASKGTYGVPRVSAELRRRGHLVNRKRVERVMREHGIAGHSRRTGRRSLTKADTWAAPAPDLIGRDFHAVRPGIKAVGDITYIPTAEGWLYLASWLDLATREIIGYSTADHHRADLVVDALGMAAGLGRLEPGCVIHTDRGSEYTSAQCRDRIQELGLRQSIGPDRDLLRQRGGRVVLRRPERGDRHPLLARPGHRPSRDLHVHRDLLQPTPSTQAHQLGLPHASRDSPALPAGSDTRGITETCPRSRGSFTRMFHQMDGTQQVAGASGFISFQNNGNPRNKAVPILRLNGKGQVAFVEVSAAEGKPPQEQ